MGRSQLELLVLYQDISMMLQEAENEKEKVGFGLEGKEQLIKAKDELAEKIEPHYLRIYQRLNSRYKRVIVPVQKSTCLGCFAKLPTSYTIKGRGDKHIITCEQCGRILYWVE